LFGEPLPMGFQVAINGLADLLGGKKTGDRQAWT
jgi:hypothetical protein